MLHIATVLDMYNKKSVIVMSALRVSPQVAPVNVSPWRGVCLRGYINEKNTAFLLCFLVAGPRIELGTS